MAQSVTAQAAATEAVSARKRRRSRRDVNTLPLMAPSVIVLLLWMIVPLALTVWFSFQLYNLVFPTFRGFAGFEGAVHLPQEGGLAGALARVRRDRQVVTRARRQRQEHGEPGRGHA